MNINSEEDSTEAIWAAQFAEWRDARQILNFRPQPCHTRDGSQDENVECVGIINTPFTDFGTHTGLWTVANNEMANFSLAKFSFFKHKNPCLPDSWFAIIIY